MAEGGEFRPEDNDLMTFDDDDDDEQEVNRTQPFQPVEASTPYNGGEQIEMQTMHEKSGLPDTSYEKTPFLTRSGSITDLHQESLLRQKMKKSVDMLNIKYLKRKYDSFAIRRGSGKNKGKIVAIGDKGGGGGRGGQYKILKDDGSDFTKRFLDVFKYKLGPRAEEIINEDRDAIQAAKG